jgi:hypothetical protein
VKYLGAKFSSFLAGTARSWTHKQGLNGDETSIIYNEKVAGRAGCPFKIFDAADCRGFSVLRIWPIFLATALQAFENQKVSCRLAPCIQENCSIPF